LKKLVYIALAAVLALTACAAPQASPGASPQVSASATVPPDVEARYREGELREYNGVHLDPAIAPVENSISGVQHVDIASYKLLVDGHVQTPLSLTYDQVTAMPSQSKVVTLQCVEGWNVTILWKGVLLSDLLNQAGIQPDAKTVIFHAADGYTTSLPLQEILDGKLMLGYGANGLPLPAEMGYPFIFVAEGKWGYKWARWVTRIELSTDTDYKGYWENSGYSNEGNVTAKP
jgi:DMSO/TMAO reductase YedYZ molybdopterin-dependent catalytic subunit